MGARAVYQVGIAVAYYFKLPLTCHLLGIGKCFDICGQHYLRCYTALCEGQCKEARQPSNVLAALCQYGGEH